MENIVLVDTNIVYYLCGISSSIIFDDKKFKSDKNQIAISFFSFFEILIKFQNDKIHLTQTLKYLNNNCIAFIHLQKEHISYNNIFKKCLYSKNKIKYYREKFTNLVIECFIDFMSDISLLIGGLYLGVLYKTEKEKDETKFLKSVFCANKLQPAFKKSCDDDFKELFNKYYNSHNKNKSDERKLQFEDIITELFKTVLFIYESYKVLNPNSETFTNEFEDLKTHIKETPLDLKDLKIKFSKYKNTQKFNTAFDKLYAELFPERENDIRTYLMKRIINKFVMDLTFDFNDIIDCLNLISFYELDADKKLNYLTCDKKWIDFLKCDIKNAKTKQILEFTKKYIKID